MKKILVIMLVISLVFGFGIYTYASDWDVAGKVLTGIEGLRILTGGKVDVIGNVTGIGRDRRDRGRHYGYRHREHCRRVWMPRFVWKKKWVPEHREYDARLGEIIVEGHYIKYKVERGGHWEYDCY